MSEARRFARLGVLLPLFLLVVTTIYLAAAFGIRTQFAEGGLIGPKTVPVLAAILMYVALLVVLAGELRGGAETETEGWRALLRPGLVALATAVYILAFRPLGYALATALYTAALFAIFRFETRRPAAFAAYVVGVTLVFYALFAWIFGVRLPAGPAGLF